MDNMTITSAQYTTDFEGNNSGIQATIDGQELFVPLDEANRHYSTILRQVEAGTLTIQDAD
jgi:glutamate racemase